MTLYCSPNQLYRPSPYALYQPAKGESVVVHTTRNKYFTLNNTATRVWQLLVAQHNQQQIISIMAGEYQVDENSLQQDISAIMSHFLTEDLLISQ